MKVGSIECVERPRVLDRVRAFITDCGLYFRRQLSDQLLQVRAIVRDIDDRTRQGERE